MIKAFLKWLRPETSSRVGMRPHRTVALDCGYDEAYDRALKALDDALGANISIDDRAGATIEAGFGLLKSERIRVTFEEVDRGHTTVHVEAFYPAGSTIIGKSAAVDALAKVLSCPSE